MHTLKYLITFIFSCTVVFCNAQRPIPVIFDTDIAPDYDDVGALAMLHAFQNKGDAKILAVISCNAFETTVPTISVINTYFNHPEIPIGVVKRALPNKDCRQQWAQAIIAKYPHQMKSNSEAMEAVSLYRKILATQPDASVTIISVGFFTNLANLLGSTKDEYSSLSGQELIAKKVKQLVSMGAGLEKEGTSSHEFNVYVDAIAARKVLTEWPTPILLSGAEIGKKIITGSNLIANDKIQNSPVKDAYSGALAFDKTPGRNSWDQTAVLVAIKGYSPYFDVRKLNFEIKDDGTNVLIPGDKLSYLVEKMPAADVGNAIETLMMSTPNK